MTVAAKENASVGAELGQLSLDIASGEVASYAVVVVMRSGEVKVRLGIDDEKEPDRRVVHHLAMGLKAVIMGLERGFTELAYPRVCETWRRLNQAVAAPDAHPAPPAPDTQK